MPTIKVEYTTSPTHGEVVRIKVVYKQEEDSAAFAQVMQIEEALQKPADAEGTEKGLGLSPITTKDSKDGEYYYLIDCGSAQHNQVQEFLSELLSTTVSAYQVKFVSQHTVTPVPQFVDSLVQRHIKTRREQEIEEQQAKLNDAVAKAIAIDPKFNVVLESNHVILSMPKFPANFTSEVRSNLTTRLKQGFKTTFKFESLVIEENKGERINTFRSKLPAELSEAEKIRAARKILEFACENTKNTLQKSKQKLLQHRLPQHQHMLLEHSKLQRLTQNLHLRQELAQKIKQRKDGCLSFGSRVVFVDYLWN